MPSSQYKDSKDALKALLDLNFQWKGTRGGKGDLKSDAPYYAAIAAFLCDEKRFLDALESASKNLWKAYRTFAAGDRNKFTRALSMASAPSGFNLKATVKPDAHPAEVVLVGGKDPDFLKFVRDKTFWKDCMNGRHGEYSHALQWLAIAEAGIVPDLTGLYARSVDWGTKNAQDGTVTLWSWLVDCFPTDMKADKLKNGTTLHSDTFRSPQYLMDHLFLRMAPDDRIQHFVASYLYWRYRNRNWLELKKAWNDDGNEVHKVTSFGGDLQAHALKKHGDSKLWTGKGEDGKDTSDPGKIQGYRRTTESASDPGSAKKGLAVKFHGVPGMLYANFAE